jgi:hypothetical protein
MCNGYVAGGNTRFFGQDKPASKPTTQQVQEAIDKRLSFADDASGEYDSMLSFIVGDDGMEASRDQAISLSSRLLPWEVNRAGGPDDKKYFPGGSAAYAIYKDVYRLDSIHFGEDIRAAENMEVRLPCQPFADMEDRSTNPRHHACAVHRAGICEQLDVLHRPAPRVLAVVEDVLRARAGPGPLWPRRAAGGESRPRRPRDSLASDSRACVRACACRMLAGVAASRCR